MMNVSDAIRQKRAVRTFTDEPLKDEELRQILNAGRKSQSSKNTQPWSFIVVRDRDMLVKLSKVGDFMGHVAGAAACIGIVLPKAGGQHAEWLMFDAGQSVAYMQLQAQELGVGSVIGTVF